MKNPCLIDSRPMNEDNGQETRQDRRADRLRRVKARIKKHGKGLAKVYRDALKKRKKENSSE